MSVDFYSCLLSCSCLRFHFMSVMILDILYLLFMSADYFYVCSYFTFLCMVKTCISFQCFSNSRHGFPHVNDMCIVFHCFSNSRHVLHSFHFISFHIQDMCVWSNSRHSFPIEWAFPYYHYFMVCTQITRYADPVTFWALNLSFFLTTPRIAYWWEG